MEKTIKQIAKKAHDAAILMAPLPDGIKNAALIKIAEALNAQKDEIFSANRLDMKNAEEMKLAAPLLKRLLFDEKKLAEVIQGIHDLSKLADPVGRTTYQNMLDEGLELFRVTCPIGVIGVIFEARPDALVQISALCLKSSNAVILKGGTEATETNIVLERIISEASVAAGIPDGWISLLMTRTDVNELLKMDKDVNLLIPRGTNAFVRYILENTKIPVLGHADGVCHTYVDEKADIDMALRVFTDAKIQYVSVCNATETLLVHENIIERMLPGLLSFIAKYNIEVYGDETTRRYIPCRQISGWHTEYLDYAISIRIVSSLQDAVGHINEYGSGHTESIITSDEAAARTFMSLVDSGNVFWNCSTRFSDGFRYGFGAEVGVSTSKIHARGPVGLEGLVTYKYKLFGHGQIVGDYSAGRSSFIHRQSNGDCPFDR
ncbi:MAG: glutamate-5-semialdehyde dehydrogenase [Saccharofermentanales bacterium]